MLVASPKMPPLIIASSIIPREQQWLWYPYVPAGAATLLFGPGGHGKSHITVDIAAKLSTGTPLPGQLEGVKPQKVLMLSAEDDFDVVLVPRLMRAGANLENIAFPKDPFALDKVGIKGLEQYIHKFGATIVFIDPIVRYMGGKVDMNKANEVREFMGALHELAMAKQTSIIIVGHSRKTRADDTAEDPERAMGSADFNNAVRSTLYVTKAADGTRVMKHVKSNYAALGDTLAFDFGDNGFKWTGTIDPEDSAVVPIRAQKLDKQVKWLKDLLAAGPVSAKEVEASARKSGLSMRTVQRLKPGRAESFMRYEDGTPVWYWRLIGDDNEDQSSIGRGAELPVSGVEDERKAAAAPVPKARRRRVDRSVDKGAGRRAAGTSRQVVERRPGSGVISNKERAEALLKAMGAK